jgi:hypothetical protein
MMDSNSSPQQVYEFLSDVFPTKRSNVLIQLCLLELLRIRKAEISLRSFRIKEIVNGSPVR